MLTPAEADYLRSLPRQVAAIAAGSAAASGSIGSNADRLRRLQVAGLVTVRAVGDSSVFLVMITAKGVAALAGEA